MEPYLSRLFRQAWGMTEKDFGLGEARPLVLKLILSLAVIIILGMFGWSEILVSTVGGWWAGIVAVLALIPLVFLWNLLFAPAQLQKEADVEIKKLKLEIENKEAKQSVLNILWDLRRQGVKIRNKEIQFNTKKEWNDAFEEWHKSVLSESKKINVNLHNWLEVLDETHGRPFNVIIWGDDDELKIRVASEILRRMQRYLEKDLIWPVANT